MANLLGFLHQTLHSKRKMKKSTANTSMAEVCVALALSNSERGRGLFARSLIGASPRAREQLAPYGEF